MRHHRLFERLRYKFRNGRWELRRSRISAENGMTKFNRDNLAGTAGDLLYTSFPLCFYATKKFPSYRKEINVFRDLRR